MPFRLGTARRWSYFFLFVCIIGRLIDCHAYDWRNEYTRHYDWADVSPGPLPVDAWPITGHLVDVFGESNWNKWLNVSRVLNPEGYLKKNLLLVSVNVNDSNHFHQCNDHQANCAGKWIEHFKPIFTGSRTEYQTDNEAKNAKGR